MSWPDLPEGWTLDPDTKQPDPSKGWFWVILPDGTRTAWNERNHMCPVCEGDVDRMADCQECAGRGMVDAIPYCDRPWDLVYVHEEPVWEEDLPGVTVPYDRPNGGQLWVGGIHCQFGGVATGPGSAGTYRSEQGNVFPGHHFDVVMSMLEAPGYEPDGDVEHHVYRIADADLDPEHHTHLDYLGERIATDVRSGKKVLVRCQAGINRSALVAVLALQHLAPEAPVQDAIDSIREARSPYVLFNKSFVAYLKEVEARG